MSADNGSIMEGSCKKKKKSKCDTPDLDFKAVLAELEKNGYAVVREAVSEEKCEEIYGLFMEYLERMSNGRFDRNDRTTWTKENLPLNVRGLIQQFNVGFQRHAIESRMAVKYIFEGIFGTNKLTSSFDGTSFTRPGKVFAFKDLDDWKTKCWEKTAIHIDQTTPGFTSLQGGLAITDQYEDEHVFVCVPKSHLYHEQLLKIAEEELATENLAKIKEANEQGKKKPTLKKTELHWSVMGPSQLEFLKLKSLQMVRVQLNRGDFVLWQSRLCHASATYCRTARPEAVRVQVFVCMARALGDEDDMKRRREAFEKGLVSKHSADRIRLFGKQPRLYSKEDVKLLESLIIPTSAAMSLDEKKLHGLVPY